MFGDYIKTVWDNEWFQLLTIVVIIVVFVMTIMAYRKADRAQSNSVVALGAAATVAPAAVKEGLRERPVDLTTPFGDDSSKGGWSSYVNTSFRSGEGFLGGHGEPPVFYNSNRSLDSYRTANVGAPEPPKEGFLISTDARTDARLLEAANGQ